MRKTLALIGKGAITAGLLYLSLSKADFNVVGERLNQLNVFWFAAGVLGTAFPLASNALRWHRIVGCCDPAHRSAFTRGHALRFTLIAWFFNQVLPSSVGGDAVRIWLLGRDRVNWSMATYSVIIDRLSGVLALSLLVLICLPWSLQLIGNPIGRTTLLFLGLGSTAACLGFILAGTFHFSWMDRWWAMCHLFSAAREARKCLLDPRFGPEIAAYSVVNQFMAVTAAWCFAKAIAAPVAWVHALFLVLPVFLISTVPLSISGWGLRESTMVLAFGYAGLHESDGLLISVMIGLAALTIGLVGGAVWIFSKGGGSLVPAANAQQR